MKRKQEIVLTLILVIIILITFFIFKPKNKENIDKKENKIVNVSSYNEFFTISGSIDKFMSFYTMKDKENLLILFDKKYKEENNIDEDNVISHLNVLDSANNYETTEITKLETTNETIYYLNGNLTKLGLDSEEFIKEYKIELIKDNRNNTFSISLPKEEGK